MKLYYFNPNDWGAQYFVMAENKIDAHKYLLKYFKDQKKGNTNTYEQNYFKEQIDIWKKVVPTDPATFPKPYKLDEYDVGQVMESENA